MFDPAHKIEVYTDGSSSHKERSGGWSWVAVQGNTTVSDSGYVPPDTTSNRMELYAPLIALLQFYADYGPCNLVVRSDSRYLILGITNPDRSRNVNIDIWKELDKAVELHPKVKWKWIRGHNGNRYNVLADKMAGEARKNGV